MPLESLFSAQVTQPYLNVPFPIQPYDYHDDRLFRHITFKESDENLTLRLSAVNQSQIVETVLVQKKVQTNFFANDASKEVFRVQAVLSSPDHGIEHSHWVTNKNLDSLDAISHNQYRIRGISDKNWKSDWVYSEIRDMDNDLIVYNMLHDVLDLLLTVHDDQIDYLMDYIVSDTFVQVITEKLPGFATSIDLDEFKTATIEELLTILASRMDHNPQEEMATRLGESFLMLGDELKKEFKESIMTSSSEFSELYRIYKLFDQYNEQQKDAMSLLMEIFLEDRYEKLVQKTDIEVLLQNDEETGIYLNGRYEFDIKSELINSVCSASLNDGFVTKIDDAVQLLSEPVVFESLVYGRDETVEKFLRLVLSEIYTPLVATDVRLLELEHALQDAHDISSTSSIVEFAILQDGEELRNLLLFDIVETLIKGDLDLDNQYEVEILDRVLKFVNDSRKALLIDYNIGEFLQVFLSVGESFRHEYNKLFNQRNEEIVLQLMDDSKLGSTKSLRSLKESYAVALNDTYRLALLKDPENIMESAYVSMIDSVLSHYNVFKKSVDEVITAAVNDHSSHQSILDHAIQEESLFANQLDNVIFRDINSYYQTHENARTAVIEATDHKDTSSVFEWQYSTTVHPEDMYYNLFRLYLREPNRYPILEGIDAEFSHDLRDVFIIDGTDLVKYALGEMGEDWPVGVFRLGSNTLKGEVSIS